MLQSKPDWQGMTGRVVEHVAPLATGAMHTAAVIVDGEHTRPAWQSVVVLQSPAAGTAAMQVPQPVVGSI